METKHTKGEWYIGALRQSVYSKNNSSDLKITIYCDNGAEELANAKLIAAAPELLEALIQINSMIADASKTENGTVNVGQLAKISINAIKKATT